MTSFIYMPFPEKASTPFRQITVRIQIERKQTNKARYPVTWLVLSWYVLSCSDKHHNDQWHRELRRLDFRVGPRGPVTRPCWGHRGWKGKWRLPMLTWIIECSAGSLYGLYALCEIVIQDKQISLYKDVITTTVAGKLQSLASRYYSPPAAMSGGRRKRLCFTKLIQTALGS
jgi:hypothetical protein